MEQIILVVHLLGALAIIGLILLQQGKGADMGASFGAGASQTLFGSTGSGNVLTKATAWLSVLFFGYGCLAIAGQLQVQSIPTVYAFHDRQPVDGFQGALPQSQVNEFVGNLLQAVVIVALVMLAFLGLRTGLVVASLIPSTMIAAFLVMSVFDIGIDQMSLASLIIALGMLVDNAIVMSESTMVQMSQGKSAKKAAIDSAGELRVPLLVSSLTTAAAFLPIYLAESNTGEYTAPLFKVVTITLICSWLLALTRVGAPIPEGLFRQPLPVPIEDE